MSVGRESGELSLPERYCKLGNCHDVLSRFTRARALWHCCARVITSRAASFPVPSNLDVTIDYKTSHTLNTNQGRQTILLAGRLPFGWACNLMIKQDKLTLQISRLPRLAGKDFPARVTCTRRSKYRPTKAAARSSISIGSLFIIINSGGTSQH